MSLRAKIEAHPAFGSIYREEDGSNMQRMPNGAEYDAGAWWCYLKEGWICPHMECGSIHEGTLAKVWELIQTAEPEKCQAVHRPSGTQGWPCSLAHGHEGDHDFRRVLVLEPHPEPLPEGGSVSRETPEFGIDEEGLRLLDTRDSIAAELRSAEGRVRALRDDLAKAEQRIARHEAFKQELRVSR